jgi:hypothetical protein
MGTINRVAYALSQRPCIFSIIPLKMNIWENILALKIDGEWYKEVKYNIRQDTVIIPRYEGYYLDSDELLRYNSRIYVPPNDKMRNLILNEAHRAVYMAHLGVTKMKAYIKPLFF